MEQQILTYISSHFNEFLILLLLVALFFKDALMEWIQIRFGNNQPTDQQRRTLEMANDMKALRMHFNDETTHLLTDIQVLLAKQEDDNMKFRETQLQQCGKLDEIRDTLRSINTNGIRIRK